MTTALVVQARLGSTRLPGKILLPALGRPLLDLQLERLQAAQSPVELIVATTDTLLDEPVRALCRRVGVRCYSGHPTDLLDRHLQAARELRADAVIKVPSDCPLIDPDALDRVHDAFWGATSRVDYASNLHPGTWPDGNDVEILPIDVLELAHREARQPYEREHTTPWIWDRPERFHLVNVRWHRDVAVTHRTVLDYVEDYQLVRAVFEALYDATQPVFGAAQIVDFLDRHPAVHALNQRWLGACWQLAHQAELRHFTPQRAGA
jgi:spore coat polysaccharide biosynthesis protein SpsF